MAIKSKIIEFYRDYMQQSLVYDKWFLESLDYKLDEIKIHENNIKLQLPLKNKKENLQKIAWIFESLKQTKDSVSLIVNSAIITSFQFFETFFFRLYNSHFQNDYMKGDFKSWIEELNNQYSNIGNILGDKIFLSILEYNKRRNLYTHSGGKITTIYINFLEKNSSVLSHLKNLDSLDQFKQNYKI
ncbi:hypothetical protein [Epilithonimonas hominis]|uniref:hypothetical protein n=1 Tax=Epilithonimonas hominis TaxID=420404 RepID=UPI0028A27378|nr:hypothetical protein [Epilithonimonas hominis]